MRSTCPLTMSRTLVRRLGAKVLTKRPCGSFYIWWSYRSLAVHETASELPKTSLLGSSAVPSPALDVPKAETAQEDPVAVALLMPGTDEDATETATPPATTTEPQPSTTAPPPTTEPAQTTPAPQPSTTQPSTTQPAQ